MKIDFNFIDFYLIMAKYYLNKNYSVAFCDKIPSK
jgi:hypothetical protein